MLNGLHHNAVLNITQSQIWILSSHMDDTTSMWCSNSGSSHNVSITTRVQCCGKYAPISSAVG